MDPQELPVYKQKDKIIEKLKTNQVIVVESPTGSGKTTQLPLILHEAGYSNEGVIGVTQPRRIATLSVCEYIKRQLPGDEGNFAAYKMRFEDTTDFSTRIKIMTDGILLQELKTDRLLSKYSVIIVDEAHERSLNIDFILGLLKTILRERKDFKVIISSATINPEIFSEYFDHCEIIHIETKIYPIQTIFVKLQEEGNYDLIIEKIGDIVTNEANKKRNGDVLVFLPGEKIIKDCISYLEKSKVRKKLFLIPLYGRLSREEQEKIFIPTPVKKIKVVVATNIAETSVTIDGITTVIDSGLAKINFYNPRTFTSSLIESQISKASCNQRKGRAGRTAPGVCYRLYSKKDFDSRPLFTREEIYRTDLSEVVLQMADLDITDFESFDFISPPGQQGLRSAVDTLKLIGAIDNSNHLTKAGRMMAVFPLLPRHSKIIVESITKYPAVLEEIIIAVSFLSTRSPFFLPMGKEIEARKEHHKFSEPSGDFRSYLNLYRQYTVIESGDPRKEFCENHYLDLRTMNEIVNIKHQLEEIISEMGIPITGGGSNREYICSIAAGLVQFVCKNTGRGVYSSFTADKIHIHPGSVMFRESPRYIVAGEIVKTSRMFARSVSVIKETWLKDISPVLYSHFAEKGDKKQSAGKKRDTTNKLKIGNYYFNIISYKGKNKIAVLPWKEISRIIKENPSEKLKGFSNMRGKITSGHYEIHVGDRVSNILRIAPYINPERDLLLKAKLGKNYSVDTNLAELVTETDKILKLFPGKKSKKTLYFISLETNFKGVYWFKGKKNFFSAVESSLASLDALAEDLAGEKENTSSAKSVNRIYRKLTTIFEEG
ncbi:MAG: ATP-dependent RNA helicase [Spirochaetes bacterium]|nr:MAG: ATP-dependent RNA helicase [Spirochaetota bacterium]